MIFPILSDTIYANPTFAHKTTKSVAVNGMDYKYIVHEIGFEDNVMFAENWPCPCITNNTLKSNIYHKQVNETGYDVIEIQKNQYIEKYVDANLTVFKFNLDPKDYDYVPIVKIYISNFWGQMNGYIGVSKIPTPSNYDLFKHSKARDSIWICPTESSWSWGWWYVSVMRNEAYDNNHFRIHWDVINTPICTNKTIISNSINNTIELIPDVGYYGHINYFQFQYYKLKINNICTNFSASVKQTDKTFGDIDMYVSLDYLTPNLDFHDYGSQSNGNDGITLLNVCSPHNTNEWYIYIGIYPWQGNNIPFVITATTDKTFDIREIVEVPPQQFLYTMAYGQAKLLCNNIEIRCEFFSYVGCLDPYDIWFCCAKFGFLPPHDDPFPWIVVQEEAMNAQYKLLPWSRTQLPSITDNVKGKIVLYQFLHKTSLNTARKYTDDNCNIGFNNMLILQNGKMLPKIVSTTEKVSECANIQNSISKINSIISSMKIETSIPLFTLYNIELSKIINSKSIIGCKKYLDKITKKDVISTTSWTLSNCELSSQFSTGYYNDACCGWNLTLFNACQSHTLKLNDIEPISILDGLSCKSNICANKTISNYIKNIQNKPILTCLNEWTNTVGNVGQLSQFVYSCATKLFGAFEFIGKYCISDSDCEYNTICDTNYGKCNHNMTHLLKCYWETANPIVFKALFNYWKVPHAINEKLFYDHMNQYMEILCIGPGAAGFRSHYQYDLIFPTCVDDCVKNNVVIECYNTDSISCPKNSVCPPGSSSNCYRRFYYYDGNQNNICETLNYVIDTDVCMDCTKSVLNNGTCEVISELNKNDCLEGYCVLYPNIHNKTKCLNKGICTNNTITTKLECENSIYCSGLDKLNIDSGCFIKFDSDFYGTPMCGLDYNVPLWGCLDKTLSKTQCKELNFSRWLDSNICDETYSCFTGSIYNYMNASDCDFSGYSWQKMFENKNNTWINSSIKPLVWKNNGTYSHRKLQNTINYIHFFNDVNQAVGNLVSLNYQRDALCRSQPLIDVLKVIACDCTNSTNDNCYLSNDPTFQIATEWICPYIYTNITSASNNVNVTVNDKVVPSEAFCQIFSIEETSNYYYQLVPSSRLSSQSFTESSPNAWSVVYSHKFISKGQIITSAYDFVWNFTAKDSFSIAIKLDINTDIVIDDIYDTYSVGIIENQIIIVQDKIVSIDNGIAYFVISNPGRYIILKTRNTDSIYQSILAQSITASIIYFILAICIVYQILNIILEQTKRWFLRTIFSCIVLIFLLIRGIYFILYPIGVIDTYSVSNYLFFEIPTYLFIVLNSVIIFLWIEIIHTVEKMYRDNSFTKRLFIAFISWNAMILICFIIFLIVFYTIEQVKTSPCILLSVQEQSEKMLYVNKAYVIFVATVCIILAISMAISGIKLIIPHMLAKTINTNEKLNIFLINTWLLMSVYTICFSIKSALMIATTFTNLIMPIIVFTLLEQIPMTVLLYYLRPPTASTVRKLADNIITSATNSTAKSGSGRSLEKTKSTKSTVISTNSAMQTK
jgi:hypothetical protein